MSEKVIYQTVTAVYSEYSNNKILIIVEKMHCFKIKVSFIYPSQEAFRQIGEVTGQNLHTSVQNE
jgi:hypothetical protein